MASPTRVASNGIFEMKTRPPSLALPAPPNAQKGLSGMLFFRGTQVERRLWHTANTIRIFSSPFTRLKEPQVQTRFFYPVVTSGRNGVCACCIRRMGWWPVAAWKTLGISVLPTEAPQHPARRLTGRTASPQSDAFGNVTLSGTTAIWECRYSWSILLSTHLRLHAVAGKIESTVSEIVQKAHS